MRLNRKSPELLLLLLTGQCISGILQVECENQSTENKRTSRWITPLSLRFLLLVAVPFMDQSKPSISRNMPFRAEGSSVYESMLLLKLSPLGKVTLECLVLQTSQTNSTLPENTHKKYIDSYRFIFRPWGNITALNVITYIDFRQIKSSTRLQHRILIYYLFIIFQRQTEKEKEKTHGLLFILTRYHWSLNLGSKGSSKTSLFFLCFTTCCSAQVT